MKKVRTKNEALTKGIREIAAFGAESAVRVREHSIGQQINVRTANGQAVSCGWRRPRGVGVEGRNEENKEQVLHSSIVSCR